MTKIREYLPTVRKVVGALVACIPLLIARGLLPADVSAWVTALTPVLVALGVYFAPANADGSAEEYAAYGQAEAEGTLPEQNGGYN